jgi:hypothetical protein
MINRIARIIALAALLAVANLAAYARNHYADAL